MGGTFVENKWKTRKCETKSLQKERNKQTSLKSPTLGMWFFLVLPITAPLFDITTAIKKHEIIPRTQSEVAVECSVLCCVPKIEDFPGSHVGWTSRWLGDVPWFVPSTVQTVQKAHTCCVEQHIPITVHSLQNWRNDDHVVSRGKVLQESCSGTILSRLRKLRPPLLLPSAERKRHGLQSAEHSGAEFILLKYSGLKAREWTKPQSEGWSNWRFQVKFSYSMLPANTECWLHIQRQSRSYPISFRAGPSSTKEFEWATVKTALTACRLQINSVNSALPDRKWAPSSWYKYNSGWRRLWRFSCVSTLPVLHWTCTLPARSSCPQCSKHAQSGLASWWKAIQVLSRM